MILLLFNFSCLTIVHVQKGKLSVSSINTRAFTLIIKINHLIFIRTKYFNKNIRDY